MTALAGVGKQRTKDKGKIDASDEYQAKDFGIGPTGDRMLDEIITWGLRQSFLWMMYRMGHKGRKNKGPLRRLQGDPGDR